MLPAMIYQQTNEGFKKNVANLSMKVGYIKQVVKDQIVIIGIQQSWQQMKGLRKMWGI